MPTPDSGLHSRFYAVIRRIPRGRVATYGQIAALAGLPRRARMVGQALRSMPDGVEVPWHRVINAQGTISPRGDGIGWAEGYQRHLLEEEGVVFSKGGKVDLDRFGWDPDRPAPRARKPRGFGAEVRAIEKILRPLGTPERAEGAKAYLKSDLDFLGVGTVPLRAAARDWLRERPEADHDALVGVVEALWSKPLHELRAFGVELLLARRKLLRSEDLDLLEDLLRRSRSWAYVDTLAIHIVGPLVERDARLNARLDRWVKDGDFWIRRSALLALLLPLRRGEGDWPRFVRYADALLREKEFFIRKAIGWVLREVAKRHPDRVRAFLREREGKVSGVTRREAEKHLE